MAKRPSIRLPRQWPKHVKSGVLHAISLASVILSYARGRATARRRLTTCLEQAESEIALLREELSIKDGRWERSRSRRRPHYTPTQRMRLLQLRAARGWNLEKTARVFLLDMQTLQSWMRRLDEHGERQLIRTVEPVNRYPDFASKTRTRDPRVNGQADAERDKRPPESVRFPPHIARMMSFSL
jgi:hypothetical protein